MSKSLLGLISCCLFPTAEEEPKKDWSTRALKQSRKTTCTMIDSLNAGRETEAFHFTQLNLLRDDLRLPRVVFM